MSETTTFLLAELHVSPLNVRTNQDDARAVDALAESIFDKGLIEPLDTHPSFEDAPPTAIGVCAGQRRLNAIRLLHEQGRWPADRPIAAVHHTGKTEAEIVLISLDENLLRRNLREHEVHAAIADALSRGTSLEAIARGSGQDPELVRRWQRLGTLEPEILAAYRQGKLSGEQAQAFAATDDLALQAAAWAEFRGRSEWDASAANIRAFYKVGDREQQRHLQFVGEAIYRGRGGRFELDLFADRPGERGRIVDEGLLVTLVQEKRAEICNRIRAEVGRSDLVFQPEPPKFGNYPDQSLSIEAPKGKAKLPAGDIVATLEIDDAGEWKPNFWWASRKAKSEALKPKGGKPAPSSTARGIDGAPTSHEALQNADGNYAQRGREIARDEHGLTADGLQVMRSLRRALLRGLLFLDAQKGGTLARDYLTWSQLRVELGASVWAEVGARPLAGEYSLSGLDREQSHVVGSYLDDTLAETVWKEQVAQISALGFIALADPADAFLDFVSQPDAVKRQAEALLAGFALLRSANTPGWRVAVHDELAQLAGGTDPARLRMLWNPTPAFAGLFGKLHRLALAQPFVERAAFKDWHRQKDKPLSGAVAAALQGEGGGNRGAEAKRWIHPLLAFGESEDGEATAPVEPELEAAE